MSNQNDFNILPEEPGEPRWLSRPWLWVLLIVAIAIFAFAVGMAVSTFSNRVGNDTANTPPTPTAIVTNAVVPTFTALPSGSPTATLPANTLPTPVGATATALVQAPTPNAPPPNTPTPITNCSRSVYEPLAAAYDANRLGCAVSDAGLVWSAWEAFERGSMFWRSDNNRAYAYFTDSSWLPVNERWDGQPVPLRGDPPAGLLVPERGFGYAWAGKIRRCGHT